MEEKKDNQKEVDHSLKLIFKSSMFVFIAIIFSKIFSYAYTVVLARYYGPEVFGIFSLASTILVLIVSFSAIGLLDGLLRFISFYRGNNEIHKIRYTFSYSITILLISSIIAGILLYLFSKIIAVDFFHNESLIIFIRIFSILVPIYMISYVFLGVMQAYEKIKMHSFLLDFLQSSLKFVLILIMIFIGLNATNAVIWSYFIGTAIVCIMGFFYCRYKLKTVFEKSHLDKNGKKDVKNNLLSYSWPLILFGIISGIFPYIDSFSIGYFKNATEVGIYNVLIPIAVLLAFFPNIFLRIFFPMISREYSNKNLPLINEISKQIEKWILILNLPFFTLIFMFPGAIINLLFGQKYITSTFTMFGIQFISSEMALRFLALGYLFYSMTQVLMNLTSMVGKSRIVLINIAITSVINLVLNIIFIQYWGISGAALATMISFIVLCLMYFIQVKKYTEIIPLKKKMVNVVISAIISAIFIFVLRQLLPVNYITIAIEIIFFLLFYLSMIFLTKSLDKSDFMIIRIVSSKVKFIKAPFKTEIKTD